jgi:uncharacterized membrane protein YeaQ/YmgE (transglycosylase-associated protein family)
MLAAAPPWPKRAIEEIGMSILAWLILGLIAGFIGSKIVNRTGEGLVLDIVLGVVGALVGGFLFNMFGAVGVTGLNLWSLVVAVVGAIVVLIVYHMIFGRRAL